MGRAPLCATGLAFLFFTRTRCCPRAQRTTCNCCSNSGLYEDSVRLILCGHGFVHSNISSMARLARRESRARGTTGTTARRLLHWSPLVKLLSHYRGRRTYRCHKELVCNLSPSGAHWIIANAILRIGDVPEFLRGTPRGIICRKGSCPRCQSREPKLICPELTG